MNAKYWENASAVMIVYDITSQESLQSCSKWLQQIQASKNGGPKFIGVLVGNKCDHRDGAIDTRAEVIQDDAATFGKQLDLEYFETSAATNTKVDEPFQYIATEFYKRYVETVAKAEELAANVVWFVSLSGNLIYYYYYHFFLLLLLLQISSISIYNYL